MASPVPDSYTCASGGAIYGGRYDGVAGTGLTVTDYASQRVFQRVGTSKAITVGGTYTGTPSLILARAVPHGTAVSAGGYAWSSLAANPIGGTYSGSLTVAQGGWYNIQVRDSVDSAVSAVGSNKWGVGPVVALIGQSNVEDMFNASAVWPSGDARSIAYISSAWNRIGNQADTFPAGSPNSTYGGAYTTGLASIDGDALVYFTNRLSAATDCPVGVLPYAVGGSNIASWVPGSGSNWTAFAAAVSAAGGDFEAGIWLQGESDAGGSMSAYKTNLAAVRAGLLSITGRSSSALPMAVVPLGPCTSMWTAEGNFGPVRQAHLEYVAGASGVYIVNSALDATLADASVHYTLSSYNRQARRWAEWVLRAASATYNTMQGPVIASATRSGAVVTVNVTHNGGTALLDAGGGSGTALLGFRVFDGGTPMTISSTAISGNTVVLTLSATPAGACTLDFGMANAPFGSGTPSASAILVDNQSINGDTIGIPLQPKPLITVT